jgi:modulator of FtsH protease HflK
MTKRGVVAWLGAIGLGAYLLTGIVVIAQDEVGVVRRFGAVRPEPYAPGMHLGFPWGLDRVDRLARDRARMITVGASDPGAAPLSRAPAAADDFLTGDLNLVTVQAQVQFRVVEPVDYLFRAASADASLAALAESALARALAARAIDDVLTTGRAEVAEQLRGEVQAGAEALKLGVSIQVVRLARVAPPVPVAPAFADATRARSDKRQVVTRAEEYRDRAFADAKGLARETADKAAARADVLIQTSRGEADRFTKLVAEVHKNPLAARQRLYLEALAGLLPRFARKIVVAHDQDLDLSLIQSTPAESTPPIAPSSGSAR